jgi:hypothetical protein
MPSNTDYNYSNYTPIDSTGTWYNPFKSAFKNIRFALATSATYTIDEADMCNLPGIAFRYYNDASAWRALLAFNGLQDAVQEVYPGLVLELPAKDDMDAYLSQQQNNQPVTIFI